MNGHPQRPSVRPPGAQRRRSRIIWIGVIAAMLNGFSRAQSLSTNTPPSLPPPAPALQNLPPVLQDSPTPLPEGKDISITDAAEAEFEGLDLETRRYLLYLFARVNQPRMAESLARKILTEYPKDRQTLLVLASLYIELKETEKALVIGKRMVQFYPTDDQAIYFLAAAHYQAGHYEQANGILKDLKAWQFKGKRYPYQTDLASSATGGEDWYRAMLAYQELLRHHQLIQPLRLEARKVLENIYREHLPQLAADVESVVVRPGVINRYKTDYKQHVTDSARLGFFANVDDVILDRGSQFRSGRYQRYDAGLRLELRQSRRWDSSYWMGGGNGGLLGGANVTRTFAQQRSLTLETYLNERATDGLLAEAIDSRQHRISLKGKYLLRHSWLIYGEALVRETLIDGEHIANGWGVNAHLEYILFHDHPELRFGYHTQWTAASRTGANPELVDAAVDRSLTSDEKALILSSLFLRQSHREGVYYNLVHQLSGALIFQQTTGVDYVFELGSIEWYANAGISFFPRKSIELKAGVGYSTSANTTDFGSDQWIISGGLKWYF